MHPHLEDYPIDTIKDGFAQHDADGSYHCLLCDARFEEGEVYRFDERFFAARRAAGMHVEAEHGPRLDQLLDSGSRYLGLTDHQKKLLRLLAAGASDAEIAAETGASPSTVRRQRFTFREKAKQARMYLAVYELAHGRRPPAGQELLAISGHSGEMDDRFVITGDENERFLKNAFESLDPLRLRALPAKEKKKVAVLNRIARQFEPKRDYSEKEVNAILQDVHPQEYVTLRRYLIEYGFMGRERDGSRYWML